MEKYQMNKEVEINIKGIVLTGEIIIPENAERVVLFSHGSGSSRHSPRNKQVAKKLQENGIGTFLFDLLTPEEDLNTSNRFDIELITYRLTAVTEWFRENINDLYPIGYFGASTGAASALWAAATQGEQIKAVVSRGGRPDLAMPVLPDVKAATLLIVGSIDYYVIGYNEQAYEMLTCTKEMKIVQGASHLFEEPGKLDEVAEMAVEWFSKYLHVKEVLL
jgi:putative phosphoribosyl transferase